MNGTPVHHRASYKYTPSHIQWHLDVILSHQYTYGHVLARCRLGYMQNQWWKQAQDQNKDSGAIRWQCCILHHFIEHWSSNSSMGSIPGYKRKCVFEIQRTHPPSMRVVPQGFVFGQFLFLSLCTKSLKFWIRSHSFSSKCYADGTLLYFLSSIHHTSCSGYHSDITTNHLTSILSKQNCSANHLRNPHAGPHNQHHYNICDS